METIQQSPPTLPEKIGKYAIQSVIGQGAYSRVYLGHDAIIDRPVAIKTLRFDLMDARAKEIELARFATEAKVVGRLRHDNLVLVYEYQTENEQPFVAMEYIKGQSLKQLLTEKRILPLNQIVSLAFQLLDGLSYIHEQRLIHRNLKPANIFIPEKGPVKIADFGLARSIDGPATAHGRLMGTPAYMSPEQSLGTALDARSDLFSLSVVLYEALTGVLPFSGPTPAAVMQSILYSEPISPRQLNPEIPESISKIILKSLSKHPAQRFPNAAEYRDALRTAFAAHTKKKTFSFNIHWLYLAAVVVVGALSLLLVQWMGNPPSAQQMQTTKKTSESTDSSVQKKESQEYKVQRLLAIAEKHMQAGRLVEPVGSSALSIYQQVLVIDPSNQDALKGIERITLLLKAQRQQ